MRITASIRINQKGISLAELMVVIVMTGIFTTIITNFMISYWRYGYILQSDLDTFNTRLNAGDILRDSIGASSGLVMQNGIADAHPANVEPTDVSGNHWKIIHAVPGNKPVGAAGTTTPLIYYRRPAANASGAYIMNGAQPYEDEYVLYLDGSSKTLKLRSLANSSASGNRLKTSCPAANVTANCPADRIIARDLSSVDMRYFSRTGNLINYTSITDPSTGKYIGPDFTAVEVVEFGLNLKKKPFLQKTVATNNSTIVRVALRNE